MSEREVDVAIIGAGTAGFLAIREIRKKTDRFVLIQDGPYGTTCARVGCMPSKSFIQIAHDYHRRLYFEGSGIHGADQLSVDLPAVMRRVRELRDRFAGNMVRKTDKFGEKFIKGRARFVEPTVLDVDGSIIRAKSIVIASGSRPIIPEAWQAFGDRIWTSDTFFEMETLPRRVAVIGLGVIGLELGQAMARLGVEVTGIARSMHLAGMTDPVVLDKVAEMGAKDMTLWRGHPPSLSASAGGIKVTAGERETEVDAVLVATGRRPNVDDMGLDVLGVPLDAKGVPAHDPETMQIGDLPVFIAGDANGAREIMHEAWDDGTVAGYNALRETAQAFQRRTPLHIIFTDPNIVAAGRDFASLDPDKIVIGEFDFEDQERALIRNEHFGVLRLYADAQTGQLLGTAMCAPIGEHLGHLLAWCIQQQLTVQDLLRMPFYHPVIEEGLRHTLARMEKAIGAPSRLDLAFADGQSS